MHIFIGFIVGALLGYIVGCRSGSKLSAKVVEKAIADTHKDIDALKARADALYGEAKAKL